VHDVAFAIDAPHKMNRPDPPIPRSDHHTKVAAEVLVPLASFAIVVALGPVTGFDDDGRRGYNDRNLIVVGLDLRMSWPVPLPVAVGEGDGSSGIVDALEATTQKAPPSTRLLDSTRPPV
jgi:hypothetical protein